LNYPRLNGLLILISAHFLFKDIGLDYGTVAESFETSAPWDRVSAVVANTKHRIESECIGNQKINPFFNQKLSSY